jgi:hypothetical protein
MINCLGKERPRGFYPLALGSGQSSSRKILEEEEKTDIAVITSKHLLGVYGAEGVTAVVDL